MEKYNQAKCNTAKSIPTGTSSCEFNLGAPQKLFLQKTSHSFSSIAEAKAEQSWNTAIKNKDILPLPLIEEFENKSNDDDYYTSPITQIDRFVREGKTKFKFRIMFDPCLYMRLRQLNGTTQRLIMVDGDRNVGGTSPDGGKFQGILSGTFRVEKFIQSDGSNPSFIPIYFVAQSEKERNDNIAIFPVDWNIKGKNGVIPASLDASLVEGTISVKVTQTCDNVPISGLSANDFRYTNPDGSETTISAVAEDTDGVYTITGSGNFPNGGTLNLKDVIVLGNEMYEGINVKPIGA